MKELEYFKAAADAVEKQALENPDIGIPVDPDVADYMGAFEEDAVSLDDVLEAAVDPED
jgi:soluble cytochrome b562